MGVKFEIKLFVDSSVEFYGDLVIEMLFLKVVEIGGDIILCLIDEIFIIVFFVIQVEGIIVIKDVVEFKVKEINCIDIVVFEFCKLGVEIELIVDGMKVYGK